MNDYETIRAADSELIATRRPPFRFLRPAGALSPIKLEGVLFQISRDFLWSITMSGVYGSSVFGEYFLIPLLVNTWWQGHGLG